MSKIILYKTQSDVLEFNKKLDSANVQICTFKAPIDILHPTILLKGVGTDYNYCYIEDFNRYYFLNKPIGVVDDLVQYSADVDVLFSNKEALKGLTFLVARNEFKANTKTADSEFITQSNLSMQSRKMGSVVLSSDSYKYYMTTNS